MKFPSYVLRSVLLLLGLACLRLALAQDPADAPKGEQDPFGPGGGKTEEKAKTDKAAPEVVKVEPLAIQVIRDSNPTTPLELMRAAQAVLQYGRADECKRYLAKLLASQPTDELLTALPAKYADFLLRLARHKDVQPEGKQVADLVVAATQREGQNPERIGILITQLSAKDRAARSEALAKLKESGTAVVTPLLRVLADNNRQQEHPYIQAALIRLAAVTEAPLVGALESASDGLKARIIEALGHMRARHAIGPLAGLASPQLAAHPQGKHPHPGPLPEGEGEGEVAAAAKKALERIVGGVPDPYEARRYLRAEAARLARGDVPYPADADNLVEMWSWDEGKQELASRKMPKADAAALLASRAARDWYAVSGDAEAQRLALLTSLEVAQVEAGLENKVSPAMLGSTGKMPVPPHLISQVLADALEQGRVPAAIAAIEVLSQSGERSVLSSKDGKPSPLAQAMVFSDRRVRLAAAPVCMRLAKGETFSGAGRLGESLGWFAGTNGTNQVLVAHPRSEDAQTLIGFMNALGYEGQAAFSGKAVVGEAIANPDVEFILISDAIDSPPVKELVQWLRRDFRTVRTPIGVMARGEHLEALTNALADDRFTSVFPRLHSTEVAAKEVEKVRAMAGRNLVGRDERIRQGQAALTALAELAKDARQFWQYDLLAQEAAMIRALYSPALTVQAANVLALYGTPKAQTALVDFASQTGRPLADRQAAAAAFAGAVKLRGLLLTQQQISTQYERYNASETLDKGTQEVLGMILNAIEAPAIARGELSKVE